MGKIGNTTFQDGCAENMSFEDFEKIYAHAVFKDDDGRILDKKKVFKAMGGKASGTGGKAVGSKKSRKKGGE